MRACARFYFRRKLRAWMYSLMVDSVLDTSQGLLFTGEKRKKFDQKFKKNYIYCKKILWLLGK